MLPHLRKTVSNRNSLHDLSGVKAPFSPNFDGNALAWYDGDLGLSAAQWQDQGSGSHHLTLTNNPQVIPNALNGHQAVRFDGVNQYGQVVTPIQAPPFSIYFVFKQIVWVSASYVLDGGVTNGDGRLVMSGSSPNLFFGNSVGYMLSPSLAVGSYGIVTAVVNGANSELRLNSNAAVVGIMGTNTKEGFVMATKTPISSFVNVEFTYLAWRSGADSTAKQDIIINWFKNRFAIV